jgi:hypothetical protein
MSAATMQMRILNNVRARVEAGESLVRALDDIAATDHRRVIQTSCATLRAMVPPSAEHTLALVDRIIQDLLAQQPRYRPTGRPDRRAAKRLRLPGMELR